MSSLTIAAADTHAAWQICLGMGAVVITVVAVAIAASGRSTRLQDGPAVTTPHTPTAGGTLSGLVVRP